ncbi:MAG: dihydroorotate dehydrogenase electron transfer subunit [Muribaculaceae bacterium]|nr:dihydroorotate dehydrogenase electron transfer subunit [Muribaculaceae bacterium]MDE6135061.1 dihydroorotate dehydrogenase electron transfer subunit [Muribaculaceae bacterium]
MKATEKKHQLHLSVEQRRELPGGLLHLVLSDPDGRLLPPMAPGQFVEVAVEKANVLLNRPFSIFNRTDNSLELLVKPLGRASGALFDYQIGDDIRVIAPLGRGFSLPQAPARVLLVGGGVGIAPLLYQAIALGAAGIRPTVVYGERTAPAHEICARFRQVADLHICTDDGSEGFRGFVTEHPEVTSGQYDLVQICGPMPMMKATASIVRGRGMACEVSLENHMACGLGACLCCVEPTTTGNRCVCTDGPVFKIEELTW